MSCLKIRYLRTYVRTCVYIHVYRHIWTSKYIGYAYIYNYAYVYFFLFRACVSCSAVLYTWNIIITVLLLISQKCRCKMFTSFLWTSSNFVPEKLLTCRWNYRKVFCIMYLTVIRQKHSKIFILKYKLNLCWPIIFHYHMHQQIMQYYLSSCILLFQKYSKTFHVIEFMREFRLPPLCKWSIHSSEILLSVDCYLATDISRQPIGPIFKVRALAWPFKMTPIVRVTQQKDEDHIELIHVLQRLRFRVVR